MMQARWVTRQSSDKLSALLGITGWDSDQDWELVHADALRVEEFIKLYRHGDLNEDDRFALMALIVASFDEWLGLDYPSAAVTERVRQIIVTNFALHESTVHYWCIWDETDSANFFRGTPFMRAVWQEQHVRK